MRSAGTPLFDPDLECHGLPCGGLVVGVALCFDFDFYLVDALLQSLLDRHFTSLLGDGDFRVAALLDIGLRALAFIREFDHLGYAQFLRLLQFAFLAFGRALDGCGLCLDLQRVGGLVDRIGQVLCSGVVARHRYRNGISAGGRRTTSGTERG